MYNVYNFKPSVSESQNDIVNEGSNNSFMGKKFKKTVENFACQNCGENVTGNGFTDHCPRCLWSKHVDVNPGDRLSKCGGIMEPVGASVSNDEWKIFYQCRDCGFTHFNKVSPEDNMNIVIELSSRPIPVSVV